MDNSEEVLQNWQDIKKQEKPQAESLLEGQERPSSSLLTSLNYQKEAAKVGFDWPTIDGAFEKFEEEWHGVPQRTRERNEIQSNGRTR